jgi:hypothetical protein
VHTRSIIAAVAHVVFSFRALVVGMFVIRKGFLSFWNRICKYVIAMCRNAALYNVSIVCSTAVTVGAIGVKVLCSNTPCFYTVSVRTGNTGVATTLVASSLVSSYSITTASSATPSEETVLPFAPFDLTTGKTYWISMSLKTRTYESLALGCVYLLKFDELTCGKRLMVPPEYCIWL